MAKKEIAVERTFLDRAIGVFSPRAEMRRLQARVAIGQFERMFEGASRGRRTQNWYANNASINTLIMGGLPTLRARSRYLCRNNPWAKKAAESLVSNTIGDGIIPQATGGGKGAMANLEDLWIDWGDEAACDADGRVDFYGLQALAMKTVVESGSCLIRRRWRRPTDNLPVPMQIQLLEPDFLDKSRDRILENGGKILEGVEFDALGRRVAYWLFPEHPGDPNPVMRGFVSARISADDVCHIYRLDRIGQCEGVPWGSSGIIRLKDLDEYEDAQLIRQKIAACFVAFVHDSEEQDVSPDAAKQALIEKVEPGIIEQLGPGKTVTFGNPPPADGYGPHTVSMLRSVAAAFGTTYEAMTGDYSQVNFSSGRMGWLEFHRNIGQWRAHMMMPQMCKPVWRWFVEAAILAGHVSKYVPATWTAPRREMIDPLKETNALNMQVRSGFKTLSEAIRETGKDPATVLDERKKDNDELDKLGIVLDSDPRRVAQKGVAQAAEPGIVEGGGDGKGEKGGDAAAGTDTKA